MIAQNPPLDLSEITIIKRDIGNRETWRYTGKVLSRCENSIRIKAFFNRTDMQIHGVSLAIGDCFVETFFTDRWYNVFEIYDRTGGNFKGLYCNVSYPAKITGGVVSYIDLALDLLVYPDGTQLVLDQDEFNKLNLDLDTKARAETALEELKLFSALELLNIQRL